MSNNEELKTVRPRQKQRMDFAPRSRSTSAPVPPVTKKAPVKMTEAEQRRREIARREVARREEIHRQIEAQKEKDIIAERRAIAARKDLARKLDIQREENAKAIANHEKELEEARIREERARRKAMLEQRAIAERQRIIAEKRAEKAREELARRREDEKLKAGPVKIIANPRGSKDPLQKPTIPAPRKPVAKVEPPKKKSLFKRNKVEQRLGSVEDFEAELNDLERETELLDENFDDIINEKVEKKPVKKAKAEKTVDNNRYVLGGRSPFINTTVEKRPLSGGEKTLERTNRGAEIDEKPKARGRFVPYNEPIPHKNIYSRTVEKEKNNKDLPTVVVGTTSKGSRISLVIAIILTVILGAIVGAIAYLAFFQ